MKEGAQEYIVKPCNPEEISLLVERIIRVKNLQRENAILRKQAHPPVPLPRHHQQERAHARDVRAGARGREPAQHGADPGRKRHRQGAGRARDPLLRRPRASARSWPSPAPRSPRRCSSRSCSATRRARSPAPSPQKKGKFELADGGTLFLDEIGDISPKLQVDLLRVLQERRFFRVGGTEEIARGRAGDRRHAPRPRRRGRGEGRFRDDLYYRLNVINIRIPPLRERREDMPLLAQALPRAAVARARPARSPASPRRRCGC